MKKLPKEKRDKIVLIGLGTVALAAGLWYGLISAQQRGLRNIAALKESQQTKVQNAERLVGMVASIEKRMEDANRELRALETGMASGDMYSWVISRINRFKQGHNVEIPQYSREVLCDVGLLPQFPYQAAMFQLRGTAFYRDFGRFVADLENQFPNMRVQNIELQPFSAANGAAEADPELLSFRLEIVALVNPNVPQP